MEGTPRKKPPFGEIQREAAPVDPEPHRPLAFMGSSHQAQRQLLALRLDDWTPRLPPKMWVCLVLRLKHPSNIYILLNIYGPVFRVATPPPPPYGMGPPGPPPPPPRPETPSPRILSPTVPPPPRPPELAPRHPGNPTPRTSQPATNHKPTLN